MPSVYEPDSALSQDELWGTLVHFRGDTSERFGLYLVDKFAKKAVCIDPGFIPVRTSSSLLNIPFKRQVTGFQPASAHIVQIPRPLLGDSTGGKSLCIHSSVVAIDNCEAWVTV